jgi:Holliday junction DNA helicase RuvA
VTDVSEALFAFASLEEKRFFRKLLKVDGVGGKTALALLGIGIPSLVRAIESADEKILSSVSGVGKKTALKVIVELKNEISGEEIVAMDDVPKGGTKKTPKDPQRENILASLVAMGYDRKLVERVLEEPELQGKSLEETTVAAIRAMARR